LQYSLLFDFLAFVFLTATEYIEGQQLQLFEIMSPVV